MKNLIVICILTFCLVSCKSYYQSVSAYHQQLDAGNFEQAKISLEQNKFLKHNRNKILLYLELGKTFHLQQAYDSSNYYLNAADLLMEDYHKTTIKDIATKMVLTSSMTNYKGEDIDRVLIHYYKALNYLYLNNNEDALVEAKRVNIILAELSDKGLLATNADGNNSLSIQKYKADAFAHILQGIIYERLNNYNDAFIAYRNAIELYEKNNNLNYLNTKLPTQLINDVINTADKSQNYSERDFYCQKYNLQFNAIKDTAKQSLVFFWENGSVPVKKQENIVLYVVKGIGGNLSYSDKNGMFNIPIILPDKDKKELKASDLSIIRITYPKYIPSISTYTQLSVIQNNTPFYPQQIEDVGFIAQQILKEKNVVDISRQVATSVLTQLASYQLKKDNPTASGAIALAALLPALIKKSDTRNWQSLPSTILYTKIPVTEGENNLTIKLKSINGQTVSDTIRYNSTHKLGILNYTTLTHLPINFNTPYNSAP